MVLSVLVSCRLTNDIIIILYCQVLTIIIMASRTTKGPWLILAAMILSITILNIFLSSQVDNNNTQQNSYDYNNNFSTHDENNNKLRPTEVIPKVEKMITNNTIVSTTSSSNSTSTTTTKQQPKKSIFHCKRDNKNGFGEIRSILKSILPEYEFVLAGFEYGMERQYWVQQYIQMENRNQHHDMFIMIIGVPTCTGQVMSWLLDEFHGTILYVSGENIGDDDYLSSLSHLDHKFILGPIQETDRSLTLTYLQMTWWKIFRPTYTQKVLTDISKKSHNNKQNFLIYAASNCIDYREKAFVELSKIGTVHYGGKCNGGSNSSSSGGGSNSSKQQQQQKQKQKQQQQQQQQQQQGGGGEDKSHNNNNNNNNSTTIMYAKNFISIKNWSNNVQFYSNYRFCLVMEHIYEQHYITEKIMMAFLGGCIPIYYGSTIVFDIFNPNSFIYYNITNSQPSIDFIQYLEQNLTAYEEILYKEPMLLEGSITIEKYFSFSDDVGGGHMKQRVRKKLQV